MTRLNRTAGQLAIESELACGTDVTGFSLLGHGWEIAHASQVGLRLVFDQVPFVSGAVRYAEQWAFPGGASDNRLYFGKYVRFSSRLSEMQQMMLFDPQTSGGLLLAVPGEKMDAFRQRAAHNEQPMWEIGEVVKGEGIDVV
jgi:selenide,water dikinase